MVGELREGELAAGAMMEISKPMRYAHSDGHTDVCYDASGRYIFTCGSDGDVRIWEGVDDDDAISHRVGDKVFAIAFKNERFYTATEINSIQAYTFPDGSPDGIVTRFTGVVTHMCFNTSGSTLVAGANDFLIKVVDVETSSQKVLRGHDAPVLSVALEPKEQLVASSSCDGTVRVWSVTDQKCLKIWPCLPNCSDVSLSKTLCRICWEPKKGEHFLVPSDKEVIIYDKNGWHKVATLTDSKIVQAISLLAFSPSGKYVAAACTDGLVCIFDWMKKKCIARHKHQNGLTITAFAWNPKDNDEIAFCDNQGQLGQIENAVHTNKNQCVATEDVLAMNSENLLDDDDNSMLLGAEFANLSNAEQENKDNDVQQKQANIGFQDDQSDDSKAAFDGEDDGNSSVAIPSRSLAFAEDSTLTSLQRPFQPGSSPDHLTNRFMRWNTVGVIKQYNTEDENSIDIEFHDTAIHHAMHLSNNLNYTVADLSTEAVILACESDADSPSKLTCLHFGSWDNAKEWTVPMPDGEEIQALAIGDGWIATATDHRLVRLFTVSGIQKQMFSIPGPVVCVTGHNKLLIVVYHRGMGVQGDQCLGITLLQFGLRNKAILKAELLPLSPQAFLTWIGFSMEGTPFYMDSSGIVRMLNRSLGDTWIPVANTKAHAKGKSDHYWIVGVIESQQELRCVPCKGSRYPPTLPRPAVIVLPFQIPFCELNTEKGQYEEKLLRTELYNGHLDCWTAEGYEVDPELKEEAIKTTREELMKLFALSVRSDRECRAVEVCDMMPDQHTVQLAIKYASRLKRLQLAQRISDMAQQKLEEELALGDNDDEEEQPNFTESPDANYSYAATEWSKRNQHQNGDENVGDSIGNDDTEAAIDEDPKPGLTVNKEISEGLPWSLSSSGRANPFKVSLPQKTTSATKGTQVFDSMSKENAKNASSSPKKASLKSGEKKHSMQMKLFASKDSDKVTNGNRLSKTRERNKSYHNKAVSSEKPSFELWLDENKSEIQLENPNLSEEDIVNIAREKFKSVSEEEKQVLKETKGKKRKRESKDKSKSTMQGEKQTSEKKKKVLSKSTNSKLASFMFRKE